MGVDAVFGFFSHLGRQNRDGSIEFRAVPCNPTATDRRMSGHMPGIFIVVDGIDGAGKTTQVQRVGDALESAGERVVRSKEPTGGQWGRKLRESATTGRLALDDELRAFVNDRKEHVAKVISPALAQGAIVILDRYYYSTIAYQGSRGADAKSIAGDMRSQFPTPDVAILLDADPEIALQRIENGRGESPNHFERIDELRAVRQVFLDLGQTDPAIRIIDGNQSIEAVYQAIAHVLVEGVLKQKRCAKDYDCDVFYCTPRIVGECRWANKIAPKLGVSTSRPSALIK
jgi:dTMP kinase